MAVLQGRTRLQLETSVLHNIGFGREVTAQANGTTTTFLIEQGLAGADIFKGYWLQFLTGANTSGQVMITTSSAAVAGVVTLTFSPAKTLTTSGDTALLIGFAGDGLHPERIYNFLNEAVTEVTPYYFDPVESLAYHTGENIRRFVLPTTMTMLKRVWYRKSVTSVQIHNCDSDWDEQTVLANVTRTVDTKDRRQGDGSLRFVFTAAAGTGVVSSKAITSLDLSHCTHVEAWVKCTVALAAGDFRILLDDTASVVSVIENLQIPALAADTWTYVRIALDTPELDSAIISVGLRQEVDKGAATFWIDEVKGVVNDSADWTLLDRNSWSIDQEGRALVLHRGPTYALLKLEGGDKPALFTADGTVSEVPEDYLMARVTGLLLLSGVGGSQLDADQRRLMANGWLGKAEVERNALTDMSNVRLIE